MLKEERRLSKPQMQVQFLPLLIAEYSLMVKLQPMKG